MKLCHKDTKARKKKIKKDKNSLPQIHRLKTHMDI